MNSVREEREMIVDLPLQDGGTSRGVMEVLAGCGITVQSCLQYGNFEKVLLVTNDPDQAVTALRSAGYQCRTENVVLVGVEDGDRWAGMRIGQALHTGGVQILHSYVSLTPSGKVQAVFQTTDNRHAIDILAADRFQLEA